MRKTKYFLVVLPLILFFYSNAVLAKDTWIKVNSKNFHLLGNASEGDIRKVGTKLEQFRETFRKLFSTANFDSAIPINVIVFKNGSAYKPFKPKRADGKIDDFIAGYFMPGRDVNYITLSTEGEGDGNYNVIFHEYVHFMVEMNFGKSEIPPWFNEGLAEYYETFKIEKDQEVKLGIFQQHHLNLLAQNKLMPLDKLFNVSNYELHQQGNHSRSIFYAESWALMHYLIQNPLPERREGLNKFLALLLTDVSPNEAFQTAFQIPYSQMETELRKYIFKSSYQYNMFSFKQKLLFDSDMQTSPLSEAASNAYLGDLLFHLNRTEDAEPYLQKALALESESSMANTTMGAVKLRQRKYAEAKPFLEKAITGNQKNHLAYYNYAYLLSKENQDEFGYVRNFQSDTATKMREALKKAIDINPAYTDSYELLAFVGLVNNDKLDEAADLLKKALKYQPGDQQIILRIAEIFSRQEKFNDAKSLAERIAGTTDDPQVKSRADNLLSEIQTKKDILANNEEMKKKYEEQRKQSEEQRKQYNSQSGQGSGNQTMLNRRTSEMTPEEVAKITEDTHILSINQALKKPAENEKQIIGRITKIACVPKSIVYSVKTESGTISLSSKDFQNLALVAFDSGAENAKISCNASLSAYNSVLTYKPSSVAKSTNLGELVAIDFVPANFRFMKESDVEQMAMIDDNQVPSETSNRPPPKLKSENDEGEIAVITNSPPSPDLETRRREMMMQSLKKALRQPEEGETRDIGTIEKIECDKNGMFFVMKTETQLLRLKSASGFKIGSFIPDVAGIQFGCGLKQLDINAVITYKANGDKKAKVNGDLVLLEFVPKTFKLD